MIKENEAAGIFDISGNGICAINTQKEDARFYVIQWDMGKFYLSSGADFCTVARTIRDYVESGRKEFEELAKKSNPERPSYMAPDDGHWLVEYMKKKGMDSFVIMPHTDGVLEKHRANLE